MAGDALKVRRSGPGIGATGDYPLEGIVDSNSVLAKLKTVDSGVEHFPSLRSSDNSNTEYGFASMTITNTARTLDDYYSDAYAGGTNNAIIPIIAQRSITLTADSGNTDAVRIGNAQTSTTVGFPLPAGSSLTLEITRGSSIFLCSESGSQTIHWIAV